MEKTIRIHITNVPCFQIPDFVEFIRHYKHLDYLGIWAINSTAYFVSLFLKYTAILKHNEPLQDIYVDELINSLKKYILTKV